jgi:hypothetical protein
MSCRRRDAQPRDDRHHCGGETCLADDIAAELRQQIQTRLRAYQLRFDHESVACTEADEHSEKRQLKEQESAVRRGEERMNRTDQLPTV